MRDVFDRVMDAHARGEEAPAVGPAADKARAVLAHDDAGELNEGQLDEMLQEVAHGAIATIARLRAAKAGGT